MDFTTLPAELIREILEGHDSVLGGLSAANEAAKAEIAQTLCPTCSVPLRPRPHPKPEVLFGTGKITYQACCPSCQKIM